jgi:soluble lytic murein transglycosylase
VERDLPRDQVPLVEAQARQRAGDLAGAAAAYAAAGDHPTALRLRLEADSSDATRRAVRGELVSLVGSRRGTTAARSAATLLRAQFAPLTAAEELAIARSLGISGPGADAVTAYAAADRAGLLDGDDRLRYARVLFNLGRHDAAAAQFARVPASHPSAGDAAYERARAVLRAGRLAESRTLLRAIPGRFPRDADAAGRALYLLADLATDEGRDAAARSTFRDLAARYPTAAMAPRARFQAAIIAYVDGAHRAAAAEMDTLARRYPNASDGLAALYWAGRAHARLGDSTAAAARWREVDQREPLSYYAVLSRRRLGLPPWRPTADSQPRAPIHALDSDFARADELALLGFDPELSREHARLAAVADSSPARLLATAEAFHARGSSSRGIALGNRAMAAGAPRDVRSYRAVYPIVHRDVLAAESAERELDPGLVAALIRQESNFLATARSPVGARGLMQLMPDVGRSVARGLGYDIWDVALLYQPDVNVRLGTTHLATLMRQYDELPHVLAAYNAGGSRVRRWLTKPGASSDPELFTERIPYVETRDYVRILERNREIYDALYSWR